MKSRVKYFFLKPGILLVGFCLILLAACHPFPEEQSKPYFILKVDTTVQFKRFIIPGDKVEFIGSYASRSSQNQLLFGAYRKRVQPFEFLGPDSAFVFTKLIPVSGKISEESSFEVEVPEGILPGEYLFYGRAIDETGSRSDSGKATLFLDVPAYPALVLDTPLNGMQANHVIRELIGDSVFRLQMRAFGTRLKQIQLQWFDSLKLDSAEVRQVFEIPGDQTQFVLNRNHAFPKRKGRRFYMRAILSTLDERKTLWWISFDRLEK